MPRRDPLADAEPLVRRIYAFVAYRVGDGPDAEDITSATFERALRYRRSYDSARGEPIGWLIGIARRCIAEHMADRVPSVATTDGAASGDLEEEAALRVTLHAAVAALGERDRELIALRYGADLTARQVAEHVGISTHAAEVALQRALARLRSALEPEPAAEGRARALAL